MFRKADRKRLSHLEYVENTVNYLRPMAETLSIQLKAIAESQQRIEKGQNVLKADLDGLRELTTGIEKEVFHQLSTFDGDIKEYWPRIAREMAALGERLAAIEEKLAFYGPVPQFTKEDLDVLRDSLPMTQHFAKPNGSNKPARKTR